jgi:hypothetical protein
MSLEDIEELEWDERHGGWVKKKKYESLKKMI